MNKPPLPLLVALVVLLTLAKSATAQPAATPLTIIKRLPADAAKDVPPDTLFTLTFASPPAYGSTGQVRIYDAADNRLVDTIDIGVPASGQNYTIGGANNFHYYPELVNGNAATFYPHNRKLEYNKTYYVQIDSGVLNDSAGGNFAGLSGNHGWVFSTKTAPPAANSARLVVAADDTGDFATVQGAVDFVPSQPAQRVTLFIQKGLYTEIVYFEGKSNLTFLGEDRKETVIGYPNNERFNNQSNTTELPTTSAYHRASFFANKSTGIHFENLTLKNSTPKGGGQAEALILTGGKNVISHVDLSSYQDTLQINDSAYITDSFIEGDVDFMWGRGPAFFINCELKSLTSGGYYTQIRNTNANHGFVYVDSTFSTKPGVSKMFISRIDPVGRPPAGRGYPYSEVVLINCTLGSQFDPAAWRLDGGATEAPNVHFWEFHSTNISDGQPADVSKRPAFTKQLTMENDAETIKNYRDPTFVLGWTPDVAPASASPSKAVAP